MSKEEAAGAKPDNELQAIAAGMGPQVETNTVSVLIGTQADTEREAFRDCLVIPSRAIWRDGVSVFCWNLETPVLADDLRLIRLLDATGMENPDDSLPVPGVDGWELVHTDPGAFYTVDQLAQVYLTFESEPDAARQVFGAHVKVFGTYNEAEYDGCTVWFAVGANASSKVWSPVKLPLAGLVHMLTEHNLGEKDGRAIVFGEMDKGRRHKKAIKSCCAIALDLDTGLISAQIDAALKKVGCLAIRYTSHSHLKRSTDLNKDELLKFGGPECVVDTDLIRTYLREKKNWEEWIIATVEFVEDDHTDEGIVCRISHDPMPKHRVIVFLRQPYVMMNEGRTHQEAMEKWAKVPEALANLLGVPFDRSCVDPSRLYYLPRHDKNRDYETVLFCGPLFEHESLNPGGVAADSFSALAAEFAKGGSKSATPEGKTLGKWWVHFGHRFQVMDAIEHLAPDRKRDGKNIECPFDSDHGTSGDPSDQACFAVNAADGGNEFCLIKCMHNSCSDKRTPDHIAKLVKDGVLESGVLTDPEYNLETLGEEIDDKTLAEIRRKVEQIGKSANDVGDDAGDAEIVPNLAELKKTIAGTDESAERDVWFPILEGIEAANLKAGDRASAHKAFKAHFGMKAGVFNAELAEIMGRKKNGPDEKTIAKSDMILTELVKAFGPNFALPESDIGGKVHVGLVDNRPWFKTSEGAPICTPFFYDGSVTYPDKNNDRGVRIRIFNAENQVVSVEFDAALLGHSSGNEVMSKVRAKGWCGTTKEGREFLLGYLGTQQIKGVTIYHRPGCRDGAFALATGDVFVPNNVKSTGFELHPDSLLKGKIRSGDLETWKEGAKVVFTNPDAWHFQLGALLGVVGPILGYLNLASMMAFFGGDSSHAKTTAQMVATAHYATPAKDGNGYMVKASGTFNAQENTLQTASCAVSALDEFGKLPLKEQAEFAFLVEGGTGKRKMNKDSSEKEPKKWHGLCVLVSAENSLGQILAAGNQRFDAGMTARLLPISFSETIKLEGEAWKAVQAMLANFGHSGPTFIRTLLEADKQTLLNRLAEIVESLPNTTGKEGSPLRHRAAHNVAYIQLAAELAIAAGLIPKTYDAAPLAKRVWDGYLASDTAPVEPGERGLQTFCDYLIHNKGVTVVAFKDKDERRSHEAMAYHSVPPKGIEPKYGEDDDGQRFYVIPTANLAKMSGGADPASLKRLLEGRGYLERPEGKRADTSMTWRRYPKIGEFPCIVVRAERVDGSDPWWVKAQKKKQGGKGT